MLTRSGAVTMRRTPPPQNPEGEIESESVPDARNVASATTVDIQEGIAVEIGRAIARALQTHTRVKAETARATCPVFGGQEHENPNEFLEKIREHADFLEIVDEEELLHLAERQLRGSASNWYAPFGTYVRTFAEFESRIRKKYDDISTRARLQAKLYSETQREQECVSLFLLRKRALFNRLSPRTDETHIIPVVIELLRSPIRAYLRSQHFYTLDELDTAASRIEEDLRASSAVQQRPPPLAYQQHRAPAPTSSQSPQPGPSRNGNNSRPVNSAPPRVNNPPPPSAISRPPPSAGTPPFHLTFLLEKINTYVYS